MRLSYSCRDRRAPFYQGVPFLVSTALTVFPHALKHVDALFLANGSIPVRDFQAKLVLDRQTAEG